MQLVIAELQSIANILQNCKKTMEQKKY
jgi:hypothetical protein